MADVLSNYVKFLRGTPTAYGKLTHKDADTLYFVSEADANVGALYLGEKLITSTTSPEGVIDHLSELKDVNIAGAAQGKVLGFDEASQKWIPMTVQAAVEVSVMQGATADADGVEGYVPAPKAGEENYFLRGDGTWARVEEPNLEGYVTQEALEEALETKVSIREGYDLISTEDAEKLATVDANAEENYIKSVTDDFAVSAEGQLSLNALDISDVNDLQNQLDSKVARKYTTTTDEEGNTITEEWTLLSPTEKEKLDALVIGEEGGIEISGTVNAENVEGLEDWINQHNDSLEGLYPDADKAKLAGIEEGAQKNYITSTTEDFKVENGQLSLQSIAVGQVANLQDLLDAKAEKEAVETVVEKVETIETTVTNLNELITNADTGLSAQVASLEEEMAKLPQTYVTLEKYNQDLEVINKSIIWQDMVTE